MGGIVKFTDLQAWQVSHRLVMGVYDLTRKFPKEELFGLAGQMRRSAVSITSNIAEGFGRRTYKDKAHFYYQARGSMSELENQLILSRDISYISEKDYNEASDRISSAHRLLQGLITKTNSLSNLISNL
ncbi:four helix bundle protein [Patescibacteria group bacterium]|nr:four helix bundle protein [Patescibacteria group bacterium]